jgi:hypothetical protein
MLLQFSVQVPISFLGFSFELFFSMETFYLFLACIILFSGVPAVVCLLYSFLFIWKPT